MSALETQVQGTNVLYLYGYRIDVADPILFRVVDVQMTMRIWLDHLRRRVPLADR